MRLVPSLSLALPPIFISLQALRTHLDDIACVKALCQRDMVEVFFEAALAARPTRTLLVGHLMHIGEGVRHLEVKLIVDGRPVVGLILVI